jgi:isoleucyl-tRNA synthetase
LNEDLHSDWKALRTVRQIANAALEEARRSKLLKSSLEAKLTLVADPHTFKLLHAYESDLPELFITSQVALETGDRVHVRVELASGQKCPRCWNYWSEQGDLCARCLEQV